MQWIHVMVPSAEGKGQWRRLVINIGGAKIWVTNIGEGKNLGKIYFQTTFSKNFEKYPSILKNFWWHFLVINNFFKNVLPSFKIYCLFFVFSFFVSVSAFFHVLFTKITKNKKLSSDYWGAKKGVLPHLNYRGRVPGLPPESTPMGSMKQILSIHCNFI